MRLSLGSLDACHADALVCAGDASVELDQDGIATTIDGQSSRRSWKDIESVTQENGYVVMQSRKGSAFLIPPRAFASTDEQQLFLSFALDALTASLMPPAEPSGEPPS